MDTLDNTDIIDKKGDINYERLSQISDDIMSGRKFLNRLSLEEEQGRRKGGRRNVEASILLATNERANKEEGQNAAIRGTRNTWRNIGDIIKQGIYWYNPIEYQEILLKKYANESDIWITSEEIEKWDYIASGMEARVYKDQNNPDYLLKVVYNYKNFSDTPLEYLDNRISLHNYLFDNSGDNYELVGFTETYGVTKNVQGPFFAFIIRQRHTKGRELEERDLPWLISEMEKRGFGMINGRQYVSKDYIINDLHSDNMLMTNEGNFHFIDTAPKLNTSADSFGGTREYGDGRILPVPEV